MNYSDYFEHKTRVDTQKLFTCLKDDAPQELRDFIYEVHQDHFNGCLPNDWIYEIIWDAFFQLREDKLEDINVEPDCYNHKLLEWLGNSYADEFCAEAIQEGLADTEKNPSIWNIVSAGQFLAKEIIFNAVNDFMESQERQKE